MPDDTSATRIERDTLGEMEVPAAALYGAQTARAVENFPVSGWTMPSAFLTALAHLKESFARANREAGLLPAGLADAVAAAALEVAGGAHLEQFPVDVFQTGSGTSTNMNMNEVLAHLANRRLGGDPAKHSPVHPNDHVNLGQSSNDVIPAAIRLSAALAWRDRVRPALTLLADQLGLLADENRGTVTLGRTHLMDAVPTTYGRVFDQWRVRLVEAMERAEASAAALQQLPLGGTAVGTGLGGRDEVVRRAVALLGEAVELTLTPMRNPAAGIAAQDTPIAHAESLAGAARVLLAVANDLRLRSSGPFGGLGELTLPATQPGSSIMPGKVNPVIPEAVMQAALEVEGLATACRGSVILHQLDLSIANPLVAWNLDTMATLLANSARILVDRCLTGMEINRERARQLAEASPAMATALARRLGYERAAEIAKAAEKAGATVAATARRLQVLPQEELDQLLDLDRIAKGA